MRISDWSSDVCSSDLEFAALHRTLGTTTLYVTHDQIEAMTLADRIVVLRDGRIEQAGAPRDLYARPDTLFVAQFLGTPQLTALPATLAEDGRARLPGGHAGDIGRATGRGRGGQYG